MQMQRQEILPGLGAPLLEGELGDIAVAVAGIQPVEQAQAGDIRHRLDIERENRRHSLAR